jgi:fructokinase
VAHDLGQYVQALHQVIALTDWLKASDEDLQTMGFTGVSLAHSQHLVGTLRSGVSAGVLSRIALTFGADGAHLDVQGQSHQLPVPRISVADTVGAGDTFWGNTLADWALQPAGAHERVANTLELSMKAAAINCTREGCQPPTLAEVLAF